MTRLDEPEMKSAGLDQAQRIYRLIDPLDLVDISVDVESLLTRPTSTSR